MRALLAQGRSVRALVHHDRRALEGYIVLPDLHNFIATLARVNSKKRAQLYSSLHNSISKIQIGCIQ